MSFVLVYQCGFCYITGSRRCGIGCILPVLPIHIHVWYTYGLTCEQVFHPVIDGDNKGGRPYVSALIVYNVATI